jgi:uncharacterized protein YndB with AHSA1/START domain
MWQREFSVLASTTPAAVWRLWSDVAGWPQWNAGIERIELKGPFAEGSEFEMQVPGQPPFTSRLLRVRENAGFEDETIVDDICVRVDHRVEPAGEGTVKITYAATVTGPGADEVGEMVTGDFPEVLAALVQRASTR